MTDSLITRTTCRICGSDELAAVIDFGAQCIAGAFAPPGGSIPEPKLPLELVRCDRAANPDGCGLLQLRHTVPGSMLYSSYWYRSGINRTMTENLHEIARQAAETVGGLQPGDLVIDVGCNDGTLLDGYAAVAPGVRCLGMDPSDVTRYAVAKGYDVINDFFGHAALEARHPGARARVITSIAMFYDLERPVAFVQDVARVLADDGIWISEFSYMPTMLEMNSFDTVCHEHLEYYSFSVIERLFALGGLEVIRADLNDVNGGSIRLFAAQRGAHTIADETAASLALLREKESALGLDMPAPYLAFAERAEAVRADLLDILRRIKAEGKTVHITVRRPRGTRSCSTWAWTPR